LYPARHFGSYARAADPRAGQVSQRHPFFLRILRDTAQVAGAAASYRYGVAGGLLVAMIIDRAMGKGMATDRLVYFFFIFEKNRLVYWRSRPLPSGTCGVDRVSVCFTSPAGWMRTAWRGVGVVDIYRSAAGIVRLFSLRQRTCPCHESWLVRYVRASLNWTRDHYWSIPGFADPAGSGAASLRSCDHFLRSHGRKLRICGSGASLSDVSFFSLCKKSFSVQLCKNDIRLLAGYVRRSFRSRSSAGIVGRAN
jgi:hypothetical protein